MAASFPKDIALDVTIGLVVIIFCTAIYIGCLLYKRKKNRNDEKDLENKVEIQKGLELELVESLEETKENQSLSITNSNSLKVKSKQSSLQNSSNSSKSDSRNSSINDNMNGHKSQRKGSIDNMNGHKSQRKSSIDNMNGHNSQKGSVSSFSSKRDPKLPSLVIKPHMPPPPPPSPLKSQNDSVDSLSKMIPSYVSDYTYSPPLSSKASMLSKPESRSD